MKKVTKILSVFCLAALLLTTTSCRKEKIIIGTWSLKEALVKAENLTLTESDFGTFQVTFNSDQSGKLYILTTGGVYKLFGITTSDPNYNTLVYELNALIATCNNGNYTYTWSGDDKVVFYLETPRRTTTCNIIELKKKQLVMDVTMKGKDFRLTFSK